MDFTTLHKANTIKDNLSLTNDLKKAYYTELQLVRSGQPALLFPSDPEFLTMFRAMLDQYNEKKMKEFNEL